jgi:hypothetical protein
MTEQEWLENRKYVHPVEKEEFKFEEEDEDDQKKQLEQLKDMFKMSKPLL